MKIQIKYFDPRDLSDALNPSSLIYEHGLFIEKISDDTLLITYPDDTDINTIINMFGRYGRIKDFVQYYLLTSPFKGLSYIMGKLNIEGFNSILKDSNSIIIDNTTVEMEYAELYELIETMLLHNFILVPYESKQAKEDNYIKVKHDFSSIYQSGLLADLEFHVSGRIFKAHKAIILGMSDYLHSFIIKYSQTQKINVIEFDEDPDLFKLMLDLIYGIPVKIDGLKTVELIKLIQYFQVKGVDIDDIVKQIKINKETESDLYVKSLSEIYLNHVPNELLEIIRNQINPATIISSLYNTK